MSAQDFFQDQGPATSGEVQICKSCGTQSEPGDRECRVCNFPFYAPTEIKERFIAEKAESIRKKTSNLTWLSAPLICLMIIGAVAIPLRPLLNGSFQSFLLFFSGFFLAMAFWVWKRPFWSGIVMIGFYLLSFAGKIPGPQIYDWILHFIFPFTTLLSFAGGLWKRMVRKSG